jgi:hypothetical protein
MLASGVPGVVGGMQVMGVREVRVVRGLFVVAFAVVPRGFAVMMSGLGVMVCCLAVMMRCVL